MSVIIFYVKPLLKRYICTPKSMSNNSFISARSTFFQNYITLFNVNIKFILEKYSSYVHWKIPVGCYIIHSAKSLTLCTIMWRYTYNHPKLQYKRILQIQNHIAPVGVTPHWLLQLAILTSFGQLRVGVRIFKPNLA